MDTQIQSAQNYYSFYNISLYNSSLQGQVHIFSFGNNALNKTNFDHLTTVIIENFQINNITSTVEIIDDYISNYRIDTYLQQNWLINLDSKPISLLSIPKIYYQDYNYDKFFVV